MQESWSAICIYQILSMKIIQQSGVSHYHRIYYYCRWWVFLCIWIIFETWKISCDHSIHLQGMDHSNVDFYFMQQPSSTSQNYSNETEMNRPEFTSASRASSSYMFDDDLSSACDSASGINTILDASSEFSTMCNKDVLDGLNIL